MLVMRTTQDSANSVGEFVSPQQSVGFDDLALAVNPFRLDGIEPRTLLGQKAAYDPHPFAAVLDAAVLLSQPAPHLFGDVPAGVVPDEKQHFLAYRFELLQAPLKKLSRYGTEGPPIYEPQPRIVEFGQVETVAGYGLRLGVVFGNRSLEEAKGLPFLAPSVQGGQSHPAPPAFILETDGPFGVGPGDFHQPVASSFF